MKLERRGSEDEESTIDFKEKENPTKGIMGVTCKVEYTANKVTEIIHIVKLV